MATATPSKTKIPFDLPPLHPGQGEVYQSDARYKVVCCGRQWGKTLYGAETCIEVAMAGGAAWWTAPTYDNAKPGYRLLTHLCRQIKKGLPGISERKTDREFHFPGGGFLAMHTLSEPDNLRGDQLDHLVVDEAAFVPSIYAWDHSLEPMLWIRRGNVLFISSPNGRNWFYELWMMGQPDTLTYDPEWQSWRFTSYDNPYGDPAELDKKKKRKAKQVFDEEYLAKFLDDSSAVFRHVKLASVAQKELPLPDHSYIIGVDLAKQNDYTVFSVFDAKRRRQVYLRRINGVNYTEQAPMLAALARDYNGATCVVEENGMEPFLDMLDRTGVRYTRFYTSNASKEAIVRQGQVAFEQWGKDDPDDADDTLKITLLHPDSDEDSDEQANEMRAFEMKKIGESGRFSYRAPYGQHDDIVMANLFAIDGMADREGKPLTVDHYNWLGR